MQQSQTETGYSPEQEIRFGAVMFGGVSLAIYMNGISQELLRMVRATAPDTSRKALLIPDKGLASTEKVYRKLGQILHHGRNPGSDHTSTPSTVRTRFVIDILSGTSAGGINAVFLAKALANNQSLTSLTKTWREQADLATLLNDDGSEQGKFPTATPKKSLLNSRRMYSLLHEALREMDSKEPPGQALADEIDLFVTATDLNGVISPINLSDETIEERVHKAHFHFAYSMTRAGQPDDYKSNSNSMLAFAARSTSSFPAAFEPMRPIDVDPMVPQFSSDILNSQSHSFRHFFLQFEERTSLPLAQRSLADGGYLNNKPFSFVIDTLRFRNADLPVARKVMFIDPFPEFFDRRAEVEFDFLENTLLAASTLPRYQTIRQDLEHLNAYNRGLRKATLLLREIETAARSIGPASQDCQSMFDGVRYPERTLSGMLEQRGACYLGYHRMRVSAVTWDLAQLISRLFGFRDDAAEIFAIRGLLQAWREASYQPNGGPDGASGPTENRFLATFDFSYRMRRLDHLKGRVDELLALLRGQAAVSDLLQLAGLGQSDPSQAILWLNAFRDEVISARRIMTQCRERLWLLYEGQPLDQGLKAERQKLADTVLRSGLTPAHLDWILKPVSEDTIQERAKAIITGKALRVEFPEPDRTSNDPLAPTSRFAPPLAGDQVRAAFDRTSNVLQALLSSPFKSSAGIIQTKLQPNDVPEDAMRQLRAFLWKEYEEYDCRDVYLFAAVQDHLVGGRVPAEIYRISPVDARQLRTEADPEGLCKLGGPEYGAFGAFLSGAWRDNDIMWGRLDGAERIIRALLPEDEDLALRKSLTAEAFDTILQEDFHLRGCDGLLRPLIAYVTERLKETPTRDCMEVLSELEKLDPGQKPNVLIPIVGAIRGNPDLIAVFRATYVRSGPPCVDARVAYMRRSLAIVSSMLEGLESGTSILNKAGEYIGMFGSYATSIVELSLSDTLLNGLARRWFLWLYSVEILLIVIGLFYQPIVMVGWLSLAVTMAFQTICWRVGKRFGRAGKWIARSVLIAVLVLIGLFVLRYDVQIVPRRFK